MLLLSSHGKHRIATSYVMVPQGTTFLRIAQHTVFAFLVSAGVTCMKRSQAQNPPLSRPEGSTKTNSTKKFVTTIQPRGFHKLLESLVINNLIKDGTLGHPLRSNTVDVHIMHIMPWASS
ncbi:hypothetical protein BDV12DRAFT_178397 [Aspergillus spectabilis]